jgi:hypothetical protein
MTKRRTRGDGGSVAPSKPSDVETEMSECEEWVDFGDHDRPCGRIAVDTRIDPDDGKPYPVCLLHVTPPAPTQAAR